MGTNCNLCSGKNYKKDYLVSGNLRYAKCSNCGLIFQHPMLNQKELEMIYENYFKFRGQLCNKEYGYRNYEKERSSDSFRKHYLGWINTYVTGKGSFLDFGCGTGNLVKLMMMEGHDAEGCEFSNEAIDVLSKKKIPFHKYDDIDKINRKFKCILMMDVIEHTKNPMGDLKKINSLLEDKGILFIETVNSDDFFAKHIYKSNWHGISPVHLYLFGKNTLIRLIKKTGFEIVNIKTYKMSGSLISGIVTKLAYMIIYTILIFTNEKEKLFGCSIERLKRFVGNYKKSSYQFSFGDGIRIVAKKI